MRIRVDEIPEEGKDVKVGQVDAWAVAAAAQALEGEVDDLAAELHLSRIAELLRINGTAQATVTRPCDRCGALIRASFSGDVELLFEPPGLDALHEEHITDPSQLNMGFFDGKAIDLTDVLMEQYALWLPGRLRCNDRNVEQLEGPHDCELAPHDGGPDLTRHNPFAKLGLPE